MRAIAFTFPRPLGALAVAGREALGRNVALVGLLNPFAARLFAARAAHPQRMAEGRVAEGDG